MRKPVLGVIVGNRGFFPSHLCETGRKTVLEVLNEEGIDAVALTPQDTEYGSIESLSDAQRCADLFKAHRDAIDGVLVTLPNFGDERAISNALRWAELNVPVLVQAFPDDVAKMGVTDRRDSFCGKMSACNNMRQYGIKYTLTSLHTIDPTSDSFRQDLREFVATCRVVKGLKNARVGVIGARPAPFNTVRFSEKLLERAGISVETIDLSEIIGAANKMSDVDPKVKAKLEEIRAYVSTGRAPNLAQTKLARLGVAIDEWVASKRLVATAVQCWTAMQELYGVVPCTLMSMMSNKLMPSACETDISGVIGMYAMALASQRPSALVDWNNNYADDPDKAVLFHCSNFPVDMFSTEGDKTPEMDYQAIIGGSVGNENTYGTVVGRVKAGPFTFCRVATDDFNGSISAYVGEGEFTRDPLNTFGGVGVVHIEEFQTLLHFICENGFEHHAAVNLSQVADPVYEAFTKYLDWDVYYHNSSGCCCE